MNPLAIGAAGLGVVGAFGSFFGKRSQAREVRRQTREQVRRLQADNNQTLGGARVAGAGSGIEFESTSLQDWLGAMDSEFTRQEQEVLRSGMKAASSVSSAAGWGLLGDLGGTMMQFGQANNWFRQPPAAPGAPSYTPGSGMPLWR